MDKAKAFLTALPSWLLSLLTVVLILWLTLMPDPLGDDAPQLFPGADKVVHAIMFGFLTVMILLDRQRKKNWIPLSSPFVWMSALFSTMLGIAIEVAQLEMKLGRGFEVADMVADTIGAALCAAIWLRTQHLWSRND